MNGQLLSLQRCVHLAPVELNELFEYTKLNSADQLPDMEKRDVLELLRHILYDRPPAAPWSFQSPPPESSGFPGTGTPHTCQLPDMEKRDVLELLRHILYEYKILMEAEGLTLSWQLGAESHIQSPTPVIRKQFHST